VETHKKEKPLRSGAFGSDCLKPDGGAQQHSLTHEHQ
jgi:hypothetical protein